MGLLDKLRGELVDIIEWIDDSRTTLVWRFPRYNNQIKNGAQLIVRPGQVAVFVHRGQLADVFQPGSYELKTDNLPILSTIMGWKHGFDSPFKSEVYFVSTRQVTDLKWGTPNPIMLRDADFGPVRVRAFGTYALRASDPQILMKELVGTDGAFETDEIGELMRGVISTSFAHLLGASKIAVMDLAANYKDLSDQLRKEVQSRIDDEYGLEIPSLFIVNISLPEEVEKAMDTRSSIGVMGDLGRYQQFQMGKAMTMAAENPSGGGAATGMGLGMGMAMATQMAQGMANAGGGLAGGGLAGGVAGAGAPPPVPNSQWFVAANGQSRGPFSMQQVIAGLSNGEINGQTLVWTNGMSAWVPASQVSQLAVAQAPTPPPIPK